jgi:hypothetical protein
MRDTGTHHGLFVDDKQFLHAILTSFCNSEDHPPPEPALARGVLIAGPNTGFPPLFDRSSMLLQLGNALIKTTLPPSRAILPALCFWRTGAGWRARPDVLPSRAGLAAGLSMA